jgi:predicted O-methyltransferase YrrM
MPQRIFTNDHFSDRIPLFKKFLSNLVGKPDLCFLEIGTFEGKSALWMLENILIHESSRLYCVDPFQSSGVQRRFENNTHEYKSKIHLGKGKSQDVLLTPLIQNQRYDFIYIDGYHESKQVLEDAVLCFGLLKVDAVMIFDDYLWHPELGTTKTPRIAINSFIRCYSEYLRLLDINYCVTVKKIRD